MAVNLFTQKTVLRENLDRLLGGLQAGTDAIIVAATVAPAIIRYLPFLKLLLRALDKLPQSTWVGLVPPPPPPPLRMMLPPPLQRHVAPYVAGTLQHNPRLVNLVGLPSISLIVRAEGQCSAGWPAPTLARPPVRSRRTTLSGSILRCP